MINQMGNFFKEALKNKVFSGDCLIKNIKDPFPELGFIPRSGLKNVTLDVFQWIHKDLEAFLLKGNIVDLGVAFIIGAAFKAIVSSFVADIIMPPIGLAMGGTDFSNLQYILQAASEGQTEVAIRYGAFIQKVLDFIIMGTAVFIALKAYENSQKKEEEAKEEIPVEPSEEVKLLTEIRDSLNTAKA